MTTEPVAVWKKGDTVEGYRVISEIGRGAASVIYLVQDPKTKQIWALKHVVKKNPKEQRFLDQTETEYKIASQLDHDSIRKIPRIIKKGTLLKTNELYLVMELVDGVSLHEEQPEDLATLVDIFHQTASALAQMHDRGFVHADMKPHNVIVGVGLDGNYTAKLIDLGQSCKTGTIKKRIQGTPDYIAPEQVHRREITPKTDIYNFGATMYWVLTGKNIPTAMGHQKDSLVGSLDDSLIEKATPVSEINPLVPDRLNDLIMQCVEVELEQRPVSMDVVSDKLDMILGMLRAESMPTQAD
ncbi:MAG: serine/threonine protein kinase [Phycisphaerales bacterium]|jgi:serine/threonine-protein kinase|nr:serine/threonine protein kinase [Phycisphaerales bacterium]